MYAFPSVHFSQNALNTAKNNGVQPDFMYCMEMLENTGIMAVPGSGFGQREGSYHFRITNLVTPTKDMVDTLEIFKEFNSKFIEKYQ